VGDVGDLVTRLVAKARIDGLTSPNEKMTLRGADALSVPLGKVPERLLSDLDVLDDVLTQPVASGLELLEQLTIVKHRPDLSRELDAALDEALGSPADYRIGLAWPHEQADETGLANAFKVLGNRRKSGPFDYLPTFDALIGTLDDTEPGDRVERLRHIKFQLLSDIDGTEVSPGIAGIKWVAFEATLQGRRYFLHNGNWYLMEQSYAERLRQQTAEILERDAGLAMPEWTPDYENEKACNAAAANQLDGLLLDRKLVRTSLHTHGIEMCDILLRDGTLVHVKRLRGSDTASHHIAQALVSAEALLYDPEAIDQLATAVERAGGGGERLPKRPGRVVLAMAWDRAITAESLFTFTQVTLVRNVTALQQRDVEVYVVPISRPTTD